MFHIQFHDGYSFKISQEIMSLFFREITYTIDKNNLEFLGVTSNGSCKMQVTFPRQKANVFQIVKASGRQKGVKRIGVEVSRLYKMVLKSVKKNDQVTLHPSPEFKHKLCVIVRPQDMSKKTVSEINILELQHTTHSPIETYKHSIPIKTHDFSKSIKELLQIDRRIGVSFDVKNKCLCLSAEFENMTKKSIYLGNRSNSGVFTKTRFYEGHNLLKLTKMSGLAQVCYFQYDVNEPLQVSCDIGDIGAMRVCLKACEDED